LAQLTGLLELGLGSAPVTDAIGPHLAQLTGLRWLYITRTQVTDAGAAAIRAALPNCIIW